ncbi:hypothetical protein VP1G_08152 [Cytospora mali]|uniref:RNA ligase domain-containing protein n=1 Tax=Cytospora mali TaxID=578113 RepID=A0A194VA88_CYTMA|nr:hypothetical protein VP1G_08152 [Valsa mali var. pyri (nom. inval.)]
MDQNPEEPLQLPSPTAHKRKLVTIRPITELRHLKGALKRFDIATVRGGWTVVVTHNAWAVDELVLYFEIDSFIPSKDERFSWGDFGSMIRYEGKMGYHVRSKMYGENISQGLIMDIERFPEVREVLQGLLKEHGPVNGMRMAQDMAFEDILGVRKWELPVGTQGPVLGRAPSFFRLPGCGRAQNIPELFTAKYLNVDFQITEKIDGVSMTVYRVQKGSQWHASLPVLLEGSTQEDETARVGVASRTEDLDENRDCAYWQAAKQIDLPPKIHKMGIPSLAVQGELIGPTIRNNSLGFAPNEPHQLIVPQIYNIDTQRCLDPRRVVQLCEAHGLPHVPVIGKVKLKEFATSVREILSKADGIGFCAQAREGLVFKVCGDEFAFKVVSNRWLLEKGE